MTMLAIIGLIVLYLLAMWGMTFLPGWLLLTLIVLAYGMVFTKPLRDLFRDWRKRRHA